jgi:signal transduction histidine kinase
VVAICDEGAPRDVYLAAGARGCVPPPADAEVLASDVRAFLAGRRDALAPEAETAGLRALADSLARHLEAAVSCSSEVSARLAESDRLRGAFMHDVAHELSTPLTPLAGYLKILSSGKLGALSEMQQKVVDGMSLAVCKLTRILDNLSDFASLQAGQSSMAAATIDPAQLVDEVVEELRPASRDARLHLEVRKSGTGGTLRGDARKLRQAFANVVANAVKFSARGGEVLVELQRDGGWLCLAVYDQGPGIAAADAGAIFEPFFHAARTRGDEARQPGSGLGLPVAKRIVEAHGGRVRVESPPHTQPAGSSRHFTGCKFVIELPLATAQPVEAARVSG